MSRPWIPLLLGRNTSVSFFPVQASGIPSGGTQDQFLVKKTATDFDFKFVTLIASMITDLTASAAELNYSKGVTSKIQDQINALTTALGNYLAKSGGTMTGNIAMGGNQITGLSDTYTPTIVNSSNVTSVVFRNFFWMRLGNICVVNGSITFDITSGSLTTTIDFTLPIASTFTDVFDCSGLCDNPSNHGIVIGSGNNAEVFFTSNGSGPVQMNVQFMYIIK